MALNNLKPHHTPAALVGPDGRGLESMPRELWEAIEAADRIGRQHGIQMKLICEACLARGEEYPYVVGENARGSLQVELTCPHVRRVYRMM